MSLNAETCHLNLKYLESLLRNVFASTMEAIFDLLFDLRSQMLEQPVTLRIGIIRDKALINAKLW